MLSIPIQSLEDPRIAAYRNLKDRELARMDGRFIAEGEHLVKRLLGSPVPCESVLVAERLREEYEMLVAGRVPLYVAPGAVLNQIVGFRFHNGALAIGVRPAAPGIAGLFDADGPATLVICPELNNGENIGSIIRTASGFGACGVLLGERCIDPWIRLSVRVSMGAVLALPVRHSDDLLRDLRELRDMHGFELHASVIDPGAVPIERVRPGRRVAILLGSEAHGLDEPTLVLCTHRVTIPMHNGTDSINVALASGIFLYHYLRIAPARG